MEKVRVHRINQETIHDLKAFGLQNHLKQLLNIYRKLIEKGCVVCYYCSEILPDEQPAICFRDVEKFDEWIKKI